MFKWLNKGTLFATVFAGWSMLKIDGIVGFAPLFVISLSVRQNKKTEGKYLVMYYVYMIAVLEGLRLIERGISMRYSEYNQLFVMVVLIFMLAVINAGADTFFEKLSISKYNSDSN